MDSTSEDRERSNARWLPSILPNIQVRLILVVEKHLRCHFQLHLGVGAHSFGDTFETTRTQEYAFRSSKDQGQIALCTIKTQEKFRSSKDRGQIALCTIKI